MKIRLLQSCETAIDGILVSGYCAGDIIDIPEENALVLITMGYAEKVPENRIDPNKFETPEHEETFMRR